MKIINLDVQHITIATLLRPWPGGACPSSLRRVHAPVRKGDSPGEQCCLCSRVTLGQLDVACQARFEQAQPRAQTKRLEGRRKIPAALREVRPAFTMQGYNLRIWKGVGRLDHVVGVHRQVKRSPGPRRTSEWQHHCRSKARS